MGFEYRATATIGGLPLVHVAFGVDPCTGERRVARGVIAIGQLAFGVVAFGQVAVGIVAVGQLGAGLAVGVGQIGFGIYALGQFAAGAAEAFGQLASGRHASGSMAWSGPPACFVLLALWLLAALWVSSASWPARRRLSRLVDADIPWRLRDARPGATVIAGRVVPLEVLEAPLSHRPCIGYEVRRAAGAERACADFLVEDRSGRARVLAEKVELFLEPTRAGRAETFAELDVVAQGAARGQSSPRRGAHMGVERVLLPGDSVVVTGFAMTTIDGGDRKPVDPKRIQLVLQSAADVPVMVTNRYLDELRAEASLGLWLAGAMALSALLLALVM